MAKRFTDTEKWKKKFLRGLPSEYKLLWFYICDECDHAGIWHVDFEVAKVKIEEDIKIEDAINFLGTKIIQFDNGEKWFIPSFIEFQYGELKVNNRAHTRVISLLNKYDLIKFIYNDKPLASPLQGAKEKEEEEEKEEDKEKEEEGSALLQTYSVTPFLPIDELAKTVSEDIKFLEPFVRWGLTIPQVQKWVLNFNRHLTHVNKTIITEPNYRQYFGNWLKFRDYKKDPNGALYSPVDEMKIIPRQQPQQFTKKL